MSKPMTKVEQACYLAAVRLQVMDLTPEGDEAGHWINDDVFIPWILEYHRKRYAPDVVACSLIDAYRAVMKEVTR